MSFCKVKSFVLFEEFYVITIYIMIYVTLPGHNRQDKAASLYAKYCGFYRCFISRCRTKYFYKLRYRLHKRFD